jgi:hypothetical protein
MRASLCVAKLFTQGREIFDQIDAAKRIFVALQLRKT